MEEIKLANGRMTLLGYLEKTRNRPILQQVTAKLKRQNSFKNLKGFDAYQTEPSIPKQQKQTYYKQQKFDQYFIPSKSELTKINKKQEIKFESRAIVDPYIRTKLIKMRKQGSIRFKSKQSFESIMSHAESRDQKNERGNADYRQDKQERKTLIVQLKKQNAKTTNELDQQIHKFKQSLKQVDVTDRINGNQQSFASNELPSIEIVNDFQTAQSDKLVIQNLQGKKHNIKQPDQVSQGTYQQNKKLNQIKLSKTPEKNQMDDQFLIKKQDLLAEWDGILTDQKVRNATKKHSININSYQQLNREKNDEINDVCFSYDDPIGPTDKSKTVIQPDKLESYLSKLGRDISRSIIQLQTTPQDKKSKFQLQVQIESSTPTKAQSKTSGLPSFGSPKHPFTMDPVKMPHVQSLESVQSLSAVQQHEQKLTRPKFMKISHSFYKVQA